MEPDEQLTVGEAKMLAATSELVATIPVATAVDLAWGELATLPARIGAGPDLAAEMDVAIRLSMGRLIASMNGAAAGREALDVA